MNEHEQAKLLHQLLEAQEKAPELDPEVLETVYILRPDMAPKLNLTADSILREVRQGPLTAEMQLPKNVTPIHKKRSFKLLIGGSMAGGFLLAALVFISLVPFVVFTPKNSPGSVALHLDQIHGRYSERSGTRAYHKRQEAWPERALEDGEWMASLSKKEQEKLSKDLRFADEAQTPDDRRHAIARLTNWIKKPVVVGQRCGIIAANMALEDHDIVAASLLVEQALALAPGIPSSERSILLILKGDIAFIKGNEAEMIAAYEAAKVR